MQLRNGGFRGVIARLDQALGHTIGLNSSTVVAEPPEWPVRNGDRVEIDRAGNMALK